MSASPYSATNVSMPDPPVDPKAMVLKLLSMVEMPEKLVSTAEERYSVAREGKGSFACMPVFSGQN